ncbi:hypothetical protein tinsulaeT_10550 [Thalassotalea insulae]|uniref:AAA+ ATPase domain-containing protein n=1 Tax=Thalassotalea insulae TaxID=2056778 RepID=A0ABQ6GNY8_9GAMM|nr:AAA family ATPase [Thalassotalea insulae]GLX77715.1 hypothetical protein tinsulaeT_10550 [Thalassotalea insulae]
MAKKKLKEILWRKANTSTIDALSGASDSQQGIELGRFEVFQDFFLSGSNKTEDEIKEGFQIVVPIEPFEGEQPIDAYSLNVTFRGTEDKSRPTWYLPKQTPIKKKNPEGGYPLWLNSRGFNGEIVEVIDENGNVKQNSKGTGPKLTCKPDNGHDDYIFLAKDFEGKVHARWLTKQELDRLPHQIRVEIESSSFGTYKIGSKMSVTSEKIIKLLKEKKNVLLYGPPGTGKTHLMQEVISNFNSPAIELDTEKEQDSVVSRLDAEFDDVLHKFVTFHQSYSYEDFVIGLRPDPESEKLLSLVPTPGVLLELSEFCRNTQNASLLSIDEINRGNVSRILGEFITLIEPNKRLNSSNEKTSSTVEITLPYMKSDSKVNVSPKGEPLEVPVPFSLPQNLFTLASMNSVDKSVAPLDAAIRRRFHIVPLEPDLRELKEHLYFEADSEDVKEVKKVSIELLDYLNCSIAQFIGKDYQLGHWYFSPLCNHFEDVKYCEEVLVDVWLHKVIPQLEELFHSRIEQLIAILKLTEETKPLRVNRPDDEFEQLGAASFIESNQGSTPEECLRHIKIICGDQENTAHEG